MHTCTCGCTHPHHMQISRCMPTTTDSGLWRWARTPSAGRAQPENCGSSFVGRAAKDCTAHAPLIHSTVHELRALAAWSQAVYGWRQTSQVIGHVTTGFCLFLRLATQVVGHLVAQLKQAWNPDRSVNKRRVQQEYQRQRNETLNNATAYKSASVSAHMCIHACGVCWSSPDMFSNLTGTALLTYYACLCVCECVWCVYACACVCTSTCMCECMHMCGWQSCACDLVCFQVWQEQHSCRSASGRATGLLLGPHVARTSSVSTASPAQSQTFKQCFSLSHHNIISKHNVLGHKLEVCLTVSTSHTVTSSEYSITCTK